MPILHCSDPAVTHTLRTAAPDLRLIPEWPVFERAASAAPLLVVHTTPVQAKQTAPRLASLRARCPFQPLVVVAPRDPNVVLHLLNVGISEMVWSDAPADEIRGTLSRARGGGLLERIASQIERSSVATASLRGCLAAAFRSSSPPRRTADLAALTHCDRTTLWKQWRAAFGPSSTFTPGRFVDWLILVHAVVRRGAGRKWADVADEIGVHEHTLSRLAQRCAGMKLRELEGAGRGKLLERLEDDVLARFEKPGNEKHVSGNTLLLKEMESPSILLPRETGALDTSFRLASLAA